MINEILKPMNNTLSVGGIFCYLEKNSVCVNHEILVDKPKFYGISGKFLTVIQSHLRQRYQKVLTDKINAYDSVSSRWKKCYKWCSSGFDLGSVTFPYLY